MFFWGFLFCFYVNFCFLTCNYLKKEIKFIKIIKKKRKKEKEKLKSVQFRRPRETLAYIELSRFD